MSSCPACSTPVAAEDRACPNCGSGLDIAESPTSRKDLKKVQDQFNAWAEESGLPLTHLSRICAMSIGENYDAATLHGRARSEE